MSHELRFERVTLSYDGMPIVREVELAVSGGEVVGLVGPNGAGKTTLLRGVTGDVRVTGGAVTLGGVRVDAMPARERARLVGVLPQTIHADAASTMHDNQSISIWH